ncbi:hypothetical protein FIBSPDRAFT_897785 [Athelia psychrophila]|uniref:Uncharacterized protein n=1 Tax=Athelia psychrophila TaxID=1759441 RepID=A0A166BR64_9AGAM|nr:hypothetical protein FIBSPDRAFT_897785 [Fibularhizoctonia sp. CBS 109695]
MCGFAEFRIGVRQISFMGRQHRVPSTCITCGVGSWRRKGEKRRDTDDKLVNSKASTHTKGGSWRSDIRQDKTHWYGSGRVGGEEADSEVPLSMSMLYSVWQKPTL